MTRAKRRLSLLFAKNRTVFGNSHFRVMSRFIEEIPKQYLDPRKADYFSRRRGFLERPGLPRASQRYGGSQGEGRFGDDFSQVYEGDDSPAPAGED